MGFTPKRKQYRLTFTDPDMSGLKVLTTSPSMGVVIDLTALSDLDPTSPEVLNSIGGVDKLFSHFANSLLEWNLEFDDGSPVPATKAGLYTQDLDFIMVVIQAWMKSTVSVAAPLPDGSSYGGLSPVASIPMETLSSSLAS